MHITLKAGYSCAALPLITRVAATEPIIEQAIPSELIHFKHGQTQEMRPASGNQGLFNENVSNAASITLFSSKQDTITELSNDT